MFPNTMIRANRCYNLKINPICFFTRRAPWIHSGAGDMKIGSVEEVSGTLADCLK